jgi:hypothetical protein
MGLVSLFWVFVGVGAVTTILIVVLGFALVALGPRWDLLSSVADKSTAGPQTK